MPSTAIEGAAGGAASIGTGVLSWLAQRRANKQAEKDYGRAVESVGADRRDTQGYQNLIAQMFGLPGFQQTVTPGKTPSVYGGGFGGGAAPGGPGGGGMPNLQSLMFGPRTTTSSGRSQSTTSEDMLTAPEIAEQFRPDIANVQNILRRRLAGPGAGMPAGYAETGARGINESFAPALQEEQNRAAKLGGSLGPVSAAGRARAGKLADFRASIPLKARELETEDIGLSERLAQTFGLGSRRRGTSSTFGTTSGSQTGPADVGNIMGLLQMLSPQARQLVQRPATPSAAGAGIGTGLSTLSSMFGGGGGGLVGSLFRGGGARNPAPGSGGRYLPGGY